MVTLQEIGPAWADEVEKLTQFVNVISKNQMVESGMFSCGKDNFFFHESLQDALRGTKLFRRHLQQQVVCCKVRPLPLT